jgi:aminopeptidase YwaD
MSRKYKLKQILILIFLIFVCWNNIQSQITIDSLQKHVYFLASDSLEGRHAGSEMIKVAADYIENQFKTLGLKSFRHNYIQKFPIIPNYGRNIIAYIEGSDPLLKDEYIVLGAHYDHIGWKMLNGRQIIYNGADDNASGVAGIIEVARKLINNKNLLKRSVIFVAFDGEEIGLLGSKYFIENPPVSKNKIKLMYSVDMIGGLKMSKELMFSGCGSFSGGVKFMNNIPKVQNLPVKFVSSSNFWKDLTDTSPFYDNDIPSLYVTTGLETPYHLPEDDAERIDYDGLQNSAEQIYLSLIELSKKESFEFNHTFEFIGSIKNDFKLGLRLDLNSNHHDYSKGPFDSKPLYGFNGGLMMQFAFANYMSLQPEILYSYYGSKNVEGDIRISSLEFPLYFNFMTSPDAFRIYVQAGPYLSYALSGKIYLTDIDFEKEKINRFDFGYKVGIGIDIYNFNLSTNVKYGYNDFFQEEKSYYGLMRNSMISFSLGYYFY